MNNQKNALYSEKENLSEEICCPICHTPISSFKTYNESITKRFCPVCKSLERQRCLALLYAKNAFGETNILHDKKILHIAAGNAETYFLRHIGCERTTIDVRPNVEPDIVGDISNMPEIASETFDVALCSFVFTNTERFHEALREIHRVLKPNGFILCHDPINLGKTVEYHDLKTITNWYSKEDYEKYHIGTFRSFGKEDYAEQFLPWFDVHTYEETDPATNTTLVWTKADKREDALLSKNFDPARSDLHSLFKPETSILPNKQVTNKDLCLTCAIWLILQNNDPNTMMKKVTLPENEEIPLFPQEYTALDNPSDTQTFHFLHPYLLSMMQNPDKNESAVNFCLKTIFSWHETYGFLADCKQKSETTFKSVWDDDDSALRMLAITLILQCCLRNRKISTPEKLELLFRIAMDHFFYLTNEEVYTSRYNHGMFQNFALFNFAWQFPELEASAYAMKIAGQRLLTMLKERLSSEGILKEHSPEYQLFFLSAHYWFCSFYGKSECAVATKPFVDKMAECLQDFLLPDGTLASLGDTCDNKRIPDSLLKIVNKDKEELKIYKDAGYAYIRTHSKGQESYLLLNGAFHSRTHKHCDDLSFVWSEGSRNILVDTGVINKWTKLLPTDDPLYAKGFWYDNTERIYSESPNAHNVVEINGQPYSRRVDPYGALPLHGGKLAENVFYLTGYWNRPEGFRQKRVLIFSPNRWLLVLDNLVSAISSKDTTFSQWFQLGTSAIAPTEKNASGVSPTVSIDGRGVYVRTLISARINSYNGDFAPRRQGWHASSS